MSTHSSASVPPARGEPKLARTTIPELSALILRDVENSARSFGGNAFDEHDVAVVRSAMEGRDAWISDFDAAHARARAYALSTLLDRPVVLISPSHGLLAREHEKLSAARHAVLWLDSLNGARAQRSATRPRILLASPAALDTPSGSRVLSSGVGLVVLDEASLASEFGQQLRPALAALGGSRSRFGEAPLHALSRAVPSAVRQDAARQLGLRSPVWHLGALLCQNVALDARALRAGMRLAELMDLLAQSERPALVLCATAHEVDTVFAGVKASPIPVRRAHAGMPAALRSSELEAFATTDERSVLVTTAPLLPMSALPGMGEDPSLEAWNDVLVAAGRAELRLIVHYHAPPSLEQYLREIAWLGRDGKAAASVLFYESAHRSLNDAMLAQQRLSQAQSEELGRALSSFLEQQRPLTLEALALHSGQSRRTTDRLLWLFADAGLLTRDSTGIRQRETADWKQALRQLAERLLTLRAGDTQRLEAVQQFAEGGDCRLRALCHYFGQSAAACGRCSRCNPAAFPRPGQAADGKRPMHGRARVEASSVQR